MAEIPQRELRNNISAVLRAAEAGTTYTVTVDGRPVAALGPHRPRQWVGRADVASLLATPTDEAVLEDVVAHDLDTGLDRDPWAEA
ncbi:MAG: type II toxin-antitoxin system prevent-host-death family antitoxin [Nitriliruptor sp.]|uniref:type II toxin-antitoxin system Phd/YefM family antitoxin n=1 Tax=Nitriliruptor sp. TaxID=2448056 RepID=UPI00349FF4C4